MMSPRPRPQSRRTLSVLLLSMAAMGATAGADAQEPVLELDPRVDSVIELFESGREAKAEKASAKLLGKDPGLEADILCALAASHNRRADYVAGLAKAQECVRHADEPHTSAHAKVERLVATAGTGTEGEPLDERLAEVREFLAGRQDDTLTDDVRIRLCHARELLPDENPSSLAHSALPAGRIKFLPKNDPEKGHHSVKPRIIRERAVNQRFDGVDELPGGEVRAAFDSVIDADGCFARARVTSSTHPLFEAPALDAVRGWVYRPPRLNGEAVAMYFSASVFMTVIHY